MCTILRMPDGKFCENMGELMDWSPGATIPIDSRYVAGGAKFERDTCLCPVDLPELAKALGATIDDSDAFETHLNAKGGDHG